MLYKQLKKCYNIYRKVGKKYYGRKQIKCKTIKSR